MKKCSYALFDMDGTLVDSMKYWRYAPVEFAEQVLGGVSEARKNALVGARTYGEFERLFISWGIQMPRAEIVRACETIMEGHYRNDIREKPGTRSLLEQLKKEGVCMGVLTLTSHRGAQVCMETTGLAPYFSCIVTPEDMPDKSGKESPGIFHYAMKKIGCESPNDCFLYEDSLYAVRTAKGLGMPVVAVRDKWAESEWEEIARLCDAWLDL